MLRELLLLRRPETFSRRLKNPRTRWRSTEDQLSWWLYDGGDDDGGDCDGDDVSLKLKTEW